MIRKDQLPNIWPDEWLPTTAAQQLKAADRDRALRLVLCSPDELHLFHLGSEGADYTALSADNIELELLPGTTAELYRLQVAAGRNLTSLSVRMHADSTLRLRTITLGGDHVRNNIVVRMDEPGCTLDATGLYLMDRDQLCDNYIFVEHGAPHCTSNTMYKGIVDDAARARFNGHVLVQDGAVKTEAHQTNRNILLTDKAHVDTRPFLEIYNDDVKCSHGSTIGQLDEQALFYLQTRGIDARTATTMLSYAFCDEVVRTIDMEPLRDTVGNMVKKRLHGELTPCDECAIRCTTPCNGEEANFRIDPSKL